MALMSMQRQYGLFPRILGKGDYAERLASLLIRMRSEMTATDAGDSNGLPTTASMPSSIIENLIIIDRGVDFSSALLTQLTYEGLIDETFSISHSQVELDSSITGTTPSQQADSPNRPASGSGPDQDRQPSLKRKIRLDGNDKLYLSLRDANFAIVGTLLNRFARRLQSNYDSRHGNKTTSELREFVNKLSGYQAEHQSLKLHTNLAGDLHRQTRTDNFRSSLEVQQNLAWGGADTNAMHEAVEDLIARDASISTVLRLLCLESTLSGGLRQKDFDYFRRAMVQAYGYQHLLTVSALEKMQILTVRSSTNIFAPFQGIGGVSSTGIAVEAQPTRNAGPPMTNFEGLRRPLRLTLEDVSEQEPEDIAYVYSGIAPLSVRLVQCVLQRSYLTSLSRTGNPAASAKAAEDTAQRQTAGWGGFEETALRQVRGPIVDEVQTSKDRSVKARQVLEGRGGRKTSVIFFVGGITFAEIAALRYIAEKEKDRRDLMICTTGIISSDKIMSTAIEESEIDKR